MLCSVARTWNDIHSDRLYGIWSWHWDRWADRWQAFKKGAPEKNGMALVGMILSGIGMAVSIIGMIVLCFVYSNLNGLSAVMMMNGVK